MIFIKSWRYNFSKLVSSNLIFFIENTNIFPFAIYLLLKYLFPEFFQIFVSQLLIINFSTH